MGQQLHLFVRVLTVTTMNLLTITLKNNQKISAALAATIQIQCHVHAVLRIPAHTNAALKTRTNVLQ